MNRKIKMLFSVILFASAPVAKAEDIAIIVHPDVDNVPINQKRIAQIFLGKSTILRPYDLPESSPLREKFYLLATGRDQAQVKATWMRLVFSGRGQLPTVVNNSAAAKEQIASDPNGIAYIKKSAVDRSVKVVLTLSD